jgi:hypothetical protein
VPKSFIGVPRTPSVGVSVTFGPVLSAGFVERNSWVPGVVVAVVLFLIGTGITLYFRRRDKDSKHLDYQILSDTPIVTSRDRPEVLKVMFGATEVSNPYITEVRFRNTGKQVIEAEDFLSHFLITRKNAKALAANIVDESADGLVEFTLLGIDPPITESGVHIALATLNAKDYFTIQVIYDVTEHEDVTVTGRIKGQTRQPQIYEEREPLSRRQKLRIAVVAGISLVCIAIAQFLSFGHKQNSAEVISGALAAAGGIFAGLAISPLYRRSRKSRRSD